MAVIYIHMSIQNLLSDNYYDLHCHNINVTGSINGGGGGDTSMNELHITSTIDATDLQTGAFIVNGGASISKNLCLMGLQIQDTTDLTNTAYLSQDPDKNFTILVESGSTKLGNIIQYDTPIDTNHLTEIYTDQNGTLHIDPDLYLELGNNAELHILDTTQANSPSTGGLICNGGAGIAKDLWVGQTVHGNDSDFTILHGGSMNLTSTIESTNHTTGATIMVGGCGIGGNLHVLKKIRSWETTESTDISTGSIISDGGVGISKNLNIGGVLYETNTTESTDTQTGCVIASGGVGIAKNLYVGGAINTSTLNIASLSLDTLHLTGTIDNTSISTGTLVVDGGIGCAKKSYFGGNMRIKSTEQATNTNSGCLIAEGGVGIARNLFVAGTIDSSGCDIRTIETQTFYMTPYDLLGTLTNETQTIEHMSRTFQTINATPVVIFTAYSVALRDMIHAFKFDFVSTKYGGAKSIGSCTGSGKIVSGVATLDSMANLIFQLDGLSYITSPISLNVSGSNIQVLFTPINDTLTNIVIIDYTMISLSA